MSPKKIKHKRTTPSKEKDSIYVDPNVSSCGLCIEKDTVNMVECDTCLTWYHFECAGLTSTPDEHALWQCANCESLTKDPKQLDDNRSTRSHESSKRPDDNRSTRSSTSSKRRANLSLERLAREKQINEKLAEEQKKLFDERQQSLEKRAEAELQLIREVYGIRQDMIESESEDDVIILGDDQQTRNELVNDWLANPTSAASISAQLHNQLIQNSVNDILNKPVEIPQNFQFPTPPMTNNNGPAIQDSTSNSGKSSQNVLQQNQPTLVTTTAAMGMPGLIQNASPLANTNPIPNVNANQNWTQPNPTIQDLNEQSPISHSSVQQPTISVSSTYQPTVVTQHPSQQHIAYQNLHQQPSFLSSTQQPVVSQSLIQQPIVTQRSTQQLAMNQGPTQQVISQGPSQQPIISQGLNQPPVVSQGSNYQPVVSQSVVQQPMLMPNYVPPAIHTSIGQSSFQQLHQGFVQQPPNVLSFNQQIPASQSFVPNQGFVQQPPNQSFTYQPSINQGTNQHLGMPTYQNANQLVPLNQNYSWNQQQIMPTKSQIAARQAMPKELPKFKGEPEKWSLFYNAFESSTATCGLNHAENLGRLQKCLEDPARKAVKYLLTQPEAVPEIIETLRMLYGRPEIIVDTLIRQLRNETAPRMDRMETFIDFAMSIRNVNSEIQKLGMWQHLYNPHLIQELIDKLPYEMRISWGEQKLLIPNANLSHFSDWLYIRARSACAVTLPTSTTIRSDKKRDEKKPEREDKKPANNSGFFNAHLNKPNSSTNDASKNLTNSDTKEEKCCQLCQGQSHHPRNCPKFQNMSYNERWETVKENKWCRCCLGKHHSLSCKNKAVCVEPDCTAKHHRLLHNPTKLTKTVAENSTNQKGLHSAHQQNKIDILRRYIPVTLHGLNGSINVIAFLDEGSDMTLIEDFVATTLGISGAKEDLYLEWTSKIVRKESESKILSLKISGRTNHKNKFDLSEVRTVKSLNLPAQTVNAQELKDRYKFLRRIPIESYENESPKILIGLMHCHLSTQLKVRSENRTGLIAAKTLLGWEVHGYQAQSINIASINFHLNHNDRVTDEDNKLHQMVAQFFSLENFGVKKPENTVEALSDKRAKQLLESTTKKIGNKYETGLLWKYDHVSLPESLPMAKRRLISLCKRFQKDPDLAIKFRAKLAEYIDKGYVRKLSEKEAAKTTSKTWYLPLFPVIYPKKPGKIRPVWDAAAKVDEISLNSMLLSGPDQLVSLPGVLLRYREGKYAITGDIREMFHQIQIKSEDQESQRFIWKEENSSKIDTYVLKVMSFGATCSPSSAQYIKNFNALQFKEQYPQAEKAIRENHYVDDWLQSFDTEEETVNVAKEVKHVHSMGGFEIRNWVSNSSKIMSELGEKVNSTDQKVNVDLDESLAERILGMWWNVSPDKFTYSLRYNPLNKDVLTGIQRPTKREVLRTLMCVYDPLGFLAAYLVHLKMLLQDIWRSGIGWDEKLNEKDDDDLYNRWRNWIKHLPDIEKIQIPRHYSSKLQFSKPPHIELHVFVDAGELAYATVAFLRIEDEDGVEISLVGGKTKVAPIKPLSIPRMELQAAVLGTRYKNFINESQSFQISRTVMWSDSLTVLSWIRSDLRKYNQFVGARIGEILETTTVPEWRWIPSKMNPADDATKWKGSFHLDTNSRWFKGPDFLREPEEKWFKTENIEETTEEMKPKHLHVHIKAEVEVLPIKFERFQQWIRSIAFALRFVNNVKAKLGRPGYTFMEGFLRREELQSAENALYRKAQRDVFKDDFQSLEENQKSSKSRTKRINKSSPIYRLSPYLDHANVLRVRGRIDAATNVSEDQKRPIILPTKHQITELIVKEYHCQFLHKNTETVINEIRQKFVIPRPRALLKRIRRECQHCKNARVMPVPPKMADLPIGRLASFTRPFTFVGVDYAGPLYVTLFRRTVKRWIVLFTCLTTRAVHLEYAHSLTTDSCINAIVRFTRRRGQVQEFYSDQGTNFKGCDNELTREIKNIDQEALNVRFTTVYTKWNFNPPLSQHMGGAWERLIRSMKITLKEILPVTHLPNDETLVTALAEIENIINSRPLTFVSIEPDDQEALTPNHFLLGSSNGSKPPGIIPPLPQQLRGNWRYAQQIADSFWHRWVKEYLPVITRRTKWFDDVKPIEVDDQVIIVDEDTPRNTWTRGVVIEAEKTGRNGRISQVKVRTMKNVYTRPVTKLAILDIKKPEAKPCTHEDLAEGSVTASDKQMVLRSSKSSVATSK